MNDHDCRANECIPPIHCRRDADGTMVGNADPSELTFAEAMALPPEQVEVTFKDAPVTATVSIRPGRAEDWQYVCNTFADEYRKTPHGRGLSKAAAKEAARRLLAGDWDLFVAAPPTGGDEIYAWILCRGRSCVAWMHVKPAYRGSGFAKAIAAAVLGEPATLDVAFWPGSAIVVRMNKRGVNLRHRPHLILEALLGSK